MWDLESIELGFDPTCWHRLSAVAAPATPPAGTTPVGHVSGAAEPAASLRSHVPVTSSVPAGGPGEPRAGARSTHASGAAPVVAAIAWVVVAAALLALAEYWRWVAIGLVVLVGLAVLGVLLEWLHARRRGTLTAPAPSRPPRRRRRTGRT